MKYLFAFLLILLASSAWSTLAFDKVSASGATTQNLSWTHTPVGTPGGVIVFVWQLVATGGSQDEVSGVSYGGVAMTELTGSPKFCAGLTGDSTTLHCFYLRSGILTGAQTVLVSGTIARAKGGGCITVTTGSLSFAFNDIDVSLCQTSGANPSVNVQLNSISSFVCMGFSSGVAATSSISPITGWTGATAQEYDLGACVGGCYYKTVKGTSDTVAKFTATTDDAAIIALVLKDSVGDSVFTLGAGTADANQSVYLQGSAKRTASAHLYVGDTCASVLQHSLISWAAVADSLNKGAGGPVYVKSCTLFVKLQSAAENTQGQIRVAKLRRTFDQDTATSVNYNTTSNWTTTYARSVTDDVDTTGSSQSARDAAEFMTAGTYYGIDITKVAQNMDAGDSASWRQGLMLYFLGPWCFSSFTCGGYGLDFGSLDFYKHNAATAGNRPKIKITYTKAVTPAATSARRRRMLGYKESVNAYSLSR